MVEEAPGGMTGQIGRLIDHDEVRCLGCNPYIPGYLLFPQRAGFKGDDCPGKDRPVTVSGNFSVHPYAPAVYLSRPLFTGKVVITSGQLLQESDAGPGGGNRTFNNALNGRKGQLHLLFSCPLHRPGRKWFK